MPLRQCHHADASFQEPGGLFKIIKVTEGEAGYSVLYRVTTLALAQRFADETNAAAGLTPDDVWDIRLSSMMAGRVQARPEPIRCLL